MEPKPPDQPAPVKTGPGRFGQTKFAPRPVSLLFLLTGISVVLLWSAVLLIQLKKVPRYRTSERARADLITPAPLTVIDRERTQLMRQKGAQNLPPIFQFHPSAADDVIARFRTSLRETRKKFLIATESTFGQSTASAEIIALPRFRRLVQSFQAENQSFPVTLPLAQAWVAGKADDDLQTQIIGRLRVVLARYLVADDLPPEARSDSPHVRMVALANPKAPVSVEQIGRQSELVNRTNLFTLDQARTELQTGLALDDCEAGRYCAGLLKENCFFDAVDTQKWRARQTASIWAADHYSAGQRIVRRGEIIDSKKLAAIAQLRAHFGIERKLWWWSGATLNVLILLAAGWMAYRPRAEKSAGHSPVSSAGSITLIPGQTSTELVISPGGKDLQFASSASAQPAEDDWRRRALEAEERAERATTTLRAELLPHLAQWCKQKLVRALFWQRAHLLETQHTGALQIAELEKRLAAIAPKLQEQIIRSESRLSEKQKERVQASEKNQTEHSPDHSGCTPK